ncbi:hypothetical protein SLV14_004322 [Streptomyces sp. Je 1-4]|uniref:hypothetical protein n=1 Tax=Streptomyces TaxID=1883 RepID=UPI002180CA26|nr:MULTISPECIES: hypothetical protein [unclassified Streptomyces]UYB41561.1 hypothetical protein SLV14_004322 [Streptomyces sp. Je 1-4]UZQ37804.1 hypothetical protein SLV14N_004322 [Streptomyces sp. Je 1-4] [Streptomyces sp. Je 1-4 4N24]UZQ45221.1 hypothetical protein SLV14NA_004322 [Streptomyces sp. Je 1-4] [Streptomyces sp. Je 1-4 4N24_ara]
MDKGIRRIAGVVMMVAGIALASWLVFGPWHYWEGDMRLVRMAMGLAATGVITGGARLIFWQPEGRPSEAAREAGVG